MIELGLYAIARSAGVETAMLVVGLGLEVARHIGIHTLRTAS